MISPTDTRKEKQNNPVETGERSGTIHHLVYKKIPVTVEMRRRQYAEQVREKHSVKKEKTGHFL